MLKLVHIANELPDRKVFPPIFVKALEEIGELRFVTNGANMSDAGRAAILREADVALLGWRGAPIPAMLANDPGKLRYVCNVTGTLKQMLPLEIVNTGIAVSNWGDAKAFDVAEGAMALLLATLKDLHAQVMTVRGGQWKTDPDEFGGTLYESNVGIYGCGAIGRVFVDMLRPFGPVIRLYDPFCSELPEGCIRVGSLRELFANSEIIAIHAGLTDETRNSVTAELLALLPRNGVVVNTARGAIVDQAALFNELRSGRLRAGLDVLEPDYLPEGHEARTWTNCILTAHEIYRGWPLHGEPPKRLERMHKICLDNLRRFSRGEPLRFTMDPIRYARST